MLWNKYNKRRVTTEFSNLDVEKNGQWSGRGRENGKKKTGDSMYRPHFG